MDSLLEQVAMGELADGSPDFYVTVNRTHADSLNPITLKVNRAAFTFTTYMKVEDALTLGQALIDAAVSVITEPKEKESDARS